MLPEPNHDTVGTLATVSIFADYFCGRVTIDVLERRVGINNCAIFIGRKNRVA